MDAPILTIEEREAINSGRWFSTLSPSLRHDILRCATVKRYKDGALMAARGEPPEGTVAGSAGGLITRKALRASPVMLMAVMTSGPMPGLETCSWRVTDSPTCSWAVRRGWRCSADGSCCGLRPGSDPRRAAHAWAARGAGRRGRS